MPPQLAGVGIRIGYFFGFEVLNSAVILVLSALYFSDFGCILIKSRDGKAYISPPHIGQMPLRLVTNTVTGGGICIISF